METRGGGIGSDEDGRMARLRSWDRERVVVEWVDQLV